MYNKILYWIRRLLTAWGVKIKSVYFLNSVLLMASAVVYIAFLMMTATYNKTDFNTLLQSNLEFPIMIILVSMNFISGATLLYYRQRLLNNRYGLKIILIMQLIQQALSLNPILFIIGGLELVVLTEEPIKYQQQKLMFKFALLVIALIYLICGMVNFIFLT